MTYPPANRCSSVSFCAILLFFFFSNSHHLRVVPLLKLKERAERRFFFLRSQCAAVHLRLYQPGGAVSYGVGRAAGWPEELLALTSVGRPGVLSVT